LRILPNKFSNFKEFFKEFFLLFSPKTRISAIPGAFFTVARLWISAFFPKFKSGVFSVISKV